jgi:endonuclease/exonuclease/phosphatase family metal-dependent hydrolase
VAAWVRPLKLAQTHPVRHRFVRLLAAYPIVWSILSIVTAAAPHRGGPLALSQIFAPHLLLPVLLLVPMAVSSKSRALRIGVVMAVAIGAVRFGPGLVSIPPAPPEPDSTIVRILSWNLEGGVSRQSDLMATLRAFDGDIVALQELSRELADSIEMDPELSSRYAHAALVPRGGAGGLGILSQFPIVNASSSLNPAIQEVDLQLSDRQLTIINAHPFAPNVLVGQPVGIPFDYDPSSRDADLLRIRAPIDRAIAAGRRLVVLGDFNVTDREPGFDDLSRGLWDAHDEVGQGAGSTWRPHDMETMPFGILRIDYVLGSPGTSPLWIFEKCFAGLSDHCMVTGDVAVE